MTAEKRGENNDPTCDEGVEISAETPKNVPSSVPSVPSPGPLLRRQDSVVPPPLGRRQHLLAQHGAQQRRQQPRLIRRHNGGKGPQVREVQMMALEEFHGV